MPSDLLSLRRDLLAAASEGERRTRDAAFRAAVEAEIRHLFDDPDYPARRRSFSVIRKRLGVFDAGDGPLREILVTMGARVFRGAGETALWELPAGPAAPEPARAPRLARTGAVVLAVTIALVASDLLLGTLTGRSGVAIAQVWLGLGRTHANCLALADGRMVEILTCHREFGALPPLH